MPNYTKLFNSIVTSTIWTEDDKTRILWITMLAMSDQNGEVHASIPGLARIAGIDVSSAEKAIIAFLSPDEYSRTPDNEGRRIVKIDGGWELLNHGKYRKMASKEDAKAATAERVRRHRARNASVTPVTQCNAAVTLSRDIAEADTDTDIDTNADTNTIPPLPPRAPSTPIAQRVAALFSRRLSTAWAEAEVRSFKAANITDEELDLIEPYYFAQRAKGREGIHRRDVKTFLNNFRGEVDRATAYHAMPEINAPQKRVTCL